MKALGVIVFWINFFVVSSFFSQVDFYVRPEQFLAKVFTNQNEKKVFISKTGSILEITPKSLAVNITQEPFIGINFGVKTSRLFCEFGIQNDGAGTTIQFRHNEFNAYDKSYTEFVSEFHSEIVTRSLNLKIGAKIIDQSNFFSKNYGLNSFLIVGLDLNSRSYKYGDFSYYSSFDYSYLTDSINRIKINVTNKIYARRVLLPTLGLRLNVTHKQTEILTFSAYCSFAAYSYNSLNHRFLIASNIKVTDVDGTEYNFLAVPSTGAGIYLGISVPIYPLKWFKKK